MLGWGWLLFLVSVSCVSAAEEAPIEFDSPDAPIRFDQSFISDPPLEDRGPGAVQLVLEGLAMAAPAYFWGVTQHEGAHALTVMLFGGEVVGFDVLPRKFEGTIRFGETRWKGEFNRTESTLVSLAPKFVDLAVLGAYTAAFETGLYPDNKHLQLLVLVLATTALVDFAKDIPATHPQNDIVKVYNSYGLETEHDRLPYRVLHGAIAAAAAIEVGRGYYQLFRKRSRSVKGEGCNFVSQPGPCGPGVAMRGLNVEISFSPAFIGIDGRF